MQQISSQSDKTCPEQVRWAKVTLNEKVKRIADPNSDLHKFLE